MLTDKSVPLVDFQILQGIALKGGHEVGMTDSVAVELSHRPMQG